MSARLCAVANVPAKADGADLIIPCQYHDLSAADGLTGEQRLMLALLIDAINVYQRGTLSRIARVRQLYVEAEHWILDKRFDAGALSFEVVCEALSINPGLLRQRIIAWKHALRGRSALHGELRLRLSVTPRSRHRSHRRGRPSTLAVGPL